MLMRMVGCGSLFLMLAVGPLAASSSDSRVNVVNHSNWAIHELYLSSVNDENWGPDQLKEHIIQNGESFLLHGIPCGSYDVRLVDEDADACVVGDVALCAGDGTWEITNDYLLACQANTGD